MRHRKEKISAAIAGKGTLVLALLVAAFAGSASPADAQQRAGAARRMLVQPPAVRTPPAMRKAEPALPQAWVEQLQEMSPQEQERFLRNNARFRSLPQAQKALIRRRLRAWNKLSDAEREAVLERQQIWQQLSPEGQREVRESLLPRWQSLPLERRRAILDKLRELRGLDSEERMAKLNDEAFLATLNEEDRQMLRDLTMLGVGQAIG